MTPTKAVSSKPVILSLRADACRSLILELTSHHKPPKTRVELCLIWWTWSGSNRRPLPCHGSALPAAPQAHFGGVLSIVIDRIHFVKPQYSSRAQATAWSFLPSPNGYASILPRAIRCSVAHDFAYPRPSRVVAVSPGFASANCNAGKGFHARSAGPR